MTSILKADDIQDSSGNNIINESGDVITIGGSGDTINVASGATNNLGITVADQWRITAGVTSDGDITSNWERSDTAPQGSLSAVTESSGIFSFPSTGIWLLQAQATFSNNTGNCHYNGVVIRCTSNNGGAWNGRADGNGSVSRPTSNNYYTQVAVKCIFDVTDTANDKTSLQVYNQEANSIIYGNSNGQTTGITFIRLGDT